MRQTWQEYFFYAMDANGTFNECSISEECFSDIGAQCCVSTFLVHEESGTEDHIDRCMIKSVINSNNLDMQLDDFSVKMVCVDSGAAKILVAGASLVTMMTYLL